MGRNRRRKREVSTPSLTIQRLLPVTRPPLSPSLTPFSDRLLQDLGDRRLYHPLQDYRPATYSTGGPARLALRDRSYGRKPRTFGASQTKAVQVFGSPNRVGICIRRHRRREVLFAKRKAGRGGSQRPHRRNWWSDVSC